MFMALSHASTFRQVSFRLLSIGNSAPLSPTKSSGYSRGVARIVGPDIRTDTATNHKVEQSPCSSTSESAMPHGGSPPSLRGGVSGGARDGFLCGGNSEGGREVAMGGSRASRPVRVFQFNHRRRVPGIAPRSVFAFLSQRVPDIGPPFRVKNRCFALSPYSSRACAYDYGPSYAAYYFSAHAGFVDVLAHITDVVDELLDPDKPHFDNWVWLQLGDWQGET
jgi:hypothetical protein